MWEGRVRIYGIPGVPNNFPSFYPQFFFFFKKVTKNLRTCLVMLFELQFSLFKQYNMYFHNTFHSHIFPQYLNNVTRTTLLNRSWNFRSWVFATKSKKWSRRLRSKRNPETKPPLPYLGSVWDLLILLELKTFY